MENLLAANSVSSFPENVWLHRSAIECLVQLNIFALWRSQGRLEKPETGIREYEQEAEPEPEPEPEPEQEP